jgi:hypothetical protein
VQLIEDDSVFYKGKIIFCVSLDRGIFFSLGKENIYKCIKEIQVKFNISLEVDITRDYIKYLVATSGLISFLFRPEPELPEVWTGNVFLIRKIFFWQ